MGNNMSESTDYEKLSLEIKEIRKDVLQIFIEQDSKNFMMKSKIEDIENKIKLMKEDNILNDTA